RVELATEDKDYAALAEARPQLDRAASSLRRTIALEKRLIDGSAGRVRARADAAAARTKAIREMKDRVTFAIVDPIDRPQTDRARVDVLYDDLDRWLAKRSQSDDFLTHAVHDLIEEAGAAIGVDLRWVLEPSDHYRAGPADFSPAERLARPLRD